MRTDSSLTGLFYGNNLSEKFCSGFAESQRTYLRLHFFYYYPVLYLSFALYSGCRVTMRVILTALTSFLLIHESTDSDYNYLHCQVCFCQYTVKERYGSASSRHDTDVDASGGGGGRSPQLFFHVRIGVDSDWPGTATAVTWGILGCKCLCPASLCCCHVTKFYNFHSRLRRSHFAR